MQKALILPGVQSYELCVRAIRAVQPFPGATNERTSVQWFTGATPNSLYAGRARSTTKAFGGHMRDLWHFEQDYDGGWQWVHTHLDSGAVSRSSDIFRTRSACVVDALGNGYLAATRERPAGKTVTVH